MFNIFLIYIKIFVNIVKLSMASNNIILVIHNYLIKIFFLFILCIHVFIQGLTKICTINSIADSWIQHKSIQSYLFI